MPAEHKVSVGWQVVATFIPIANIWAFYRIRRLRKYVLYVVLPSVAFSIAYLSYIFDKLALPGATRPFYNSGPTYEIVNLDPFLYVLSQVIGWGLQGFAIYLVIIWSRQHNRAYESTTPAATS